MAAIDPSAPAQEAENISADAPRATLKIIREPIGAADSDEGDDDNDFDSDQLRALLSEPGDEDDSEEDDEDTDENGEGPSDPSKVQRARADVLKKELDNEGDDDEMENGIPNGINGVGKAKKGKAKVVDDDDEDEDELEDNDDTEEMEEFVICTLDPNKVRSSVAVEK